MIRISEEELIIESQKHPKTFEKLYDRHYSDVLYFIHRRINDQEVSAKITQKVFLESLKEINKETDQSFTNSLLRIAVKYCNKYFRTKGKIRHIIINEGAAITILNQICLTHDTVANMEKLKSVLNKLSLREIELIELCFADKKTFQDTGYILNISENKTRVKTYELLSKICTLVKHEHNVLTQNFSCPISQDKVVSSMNFKSLWSDYNDNKATFFEDLIESYNVIDTTILKRALRITGVVLIIIMVLPNQNVPTKEIANVIAKETVQINNLDVPKSKNVDPEKSPLEKL